MIVTRKTPKLSKSPLLLALLASLALLTSSCTEDGDITSPEISISSPGENDVFTVDQMIDLVGRATDDVALQNLNISSDLGIDENISSFDDASDFPFNFILTLDTLTAPGEYSISLTATDTSGNTDEEVVNIQIQ